jgi:hypothetical protein
MPNLGAAEVAVIAVLVLLFIVRLISRLGVSVRGPALVLKRFDNRPKDPRTLLNLVGRRRGLGGWFMSMIGIDITTTLSITQDFVYLDQASLSGRVRQTAPVDQIASTHCGYSMNLIPLILAGVVLIAGVVAAVDSGSFWPLVTGLLVALTLVWAFVLSKCLMIAFETSGGAVLGVRFKRGIIDSVPVNIEQLDAVVALFNQQMSRSPAPAGPVSYAEEALD